MKHSQGVQIKSTLCFNSVNYYIHTFIHIAKCLNVKYKGLRGDYWN